MAVPIVGWLRGAAGRVGRDFRLMRAAWRTTWALRRLDREAVVQRPALAEACRALGEAACRQGAGGDLAPMEDVTKHAEALAQAEADLEEREEAVAAARAALESARAAHAERVAPLEAAYRPLAEAEAAARAGLQAAERELGDLKVAAGQDRGRDRRRPRGPADLRARGGTAAAGGRAEAGSRSRREARRAAAAEELQPHEAKAAEARQALKPPSGRRPKRTRACPPICRLPRAPGTRPAARSRRAASGWAVPTPTSAPPWWSRAQEPEGLHEEFAAAQAACSRAAAADAQMAELRREREAAKGGAARFALYSVGALAAVVAVVLIVWHLAAPAPPPPADADVDCY